MMLSLLQRYVFGIGLAASGMKMIRPEFWPANGSWSPSLAVVLIFGSLVLADQTEARAQMQVVEGQHIKLKADSGTTEELTEWVQAFDAAVPQWEAFWGFPPGMLSDWKVDAFVMEKPERFRSNGDLPRRLKFPYGFAIPGNIWVVRQPGPYYTRHLLLHEGVHALVIDQFNGTGPSWFAEGVAEMLGVHEGTGRDVRINIVPPNRESAPYWGRFKLLTQRRDDADIPTMNAVMSFPQNMQADVEAYGWSWALAMMMTQYPEYRDATFDAARRGADISPAFGRAFKRSLQSQWPILEARWRLLANTVDYGFDWEREKVDLSIKDPLWKGRPVEFNVRADRGWQSTGARFPPGTTIKISAKGKCSLNDVPEPWISEPPGVTIHYANGRPLGQLLACVVPNRTQEKESLKPLRIIPIESETEIVLNDHSWILFRINDHLGSMGDNRDGYAVRIRR